MSAKERGRALSSVRGFLWASAKKCVRISGSWYDRMGFPCGRSGGILQTSSLTERKFGVSYLYSVNMEPLLSAPLLRGHDPLPYPMTWTSPSFRRYSLGLKSSWQLLPVTQSLLITQVNPSWFFIWSMHKGQNFSPSSWEKCKQTITFYGLFKDVSIQGQRVSNYKTADKL